MFDVVIPALMLLNLRPHHASFPRQYELESRQRSILDESRSLDYHTLHLYQGCGQELTHIERALVEE